MEEVQTTPLNHAMHEAQRRIDKWVSLNDTTAALDLIGLYLTELPELPPNLKKLLCFNNQLTKLPELPQGLEELRCMHNQLIELPPLPSSLKKLWCNNNQLTKLPLLPQGLEELYCENNYLQYPPPDVMISPSLNEIREWMSENPLSFVKSATKR